MEKLSWHVRISVVRMCGITVGNFRRMLNRAVSSHVVRELWARQARRARQARLAKMELPNCPAFRASLASLAQITRNDARFNGVENAAWENACLWVKRLSWQPQGGRVK
jgi:CRP-like cAMP-binding protein